MYYFSSFVMYLNFGRTHFVSSDFNALCNTLHEFLLGNKNKYIQRNKIHISANFYGMLNSRCKWNGKTCNITKDFKTTLTDLGVCYTFNYDHPPLSVKEPGDNYN